VGSASPLTERWRSSTCTTKIQIDTPRWRAA
jgi:hypothetical protein